MSMKGMSMREVKLGRDKSEREEDGEAEDEAVEGAPCDRQTSVMVSPVLFATRARRFTQFPQGHPEVHLEDGNPEVPREGASRAMSS